MKFNGCIPVSFARFFFGVKRTYVLAPPVYFYPRSPFLNRFYERNSFNSRSVRLRNFPITAVLNAIGFSQINKFVVRRVAVNMIDHRQRPSSRHKKPSQPVSIVKPIINANSDVAIWMNTSCRMTSLPSAPSVFFPYKSSFFGIIIQKLKGASGSLICFHLSIMSYLMTFINRRLLSHP